METSLLKYIILSRDVTEYVGTSKRARRRVIFKWSDPRRHHSHLLVQEHNSRQHLQYICGADTSENPQHITKRMSQTQFVLVGLQKLNACDINITRLCSSVAEGQLAVDNPCLTCGESDCNIEQPLFEGSLCQNRAQNFVELLHSGWNGFQSQCSMCTRDNMFV